MKTLKILAAQGLLLFSLFFGYGQNTPYSEIVLRKKIKPTLIKRAPEKCPIDCCYCFDNLYVSSTKNVEADIYVINTTTGDFCSEAVTLSQEPVSIPAFGDGEYRIEVTLSDGDIYYGEFEIE